MKFSTVVCAAVVSSAYALPRGFDFDSSVDANKYNVDQNSESNTFGDQRGSGGKASTGKSGILGFGIGNDNTLRPNSNAGGGRNSVKGGDSSNAVNIGKRWFGSGRVSSDVDANRYNIDQDSSSNTYADQSGSGGKSRTGKSGIFGSGRGNDNVLIPSSNSQGGSNSVVGGDSSNSVKINGRDHIFIARQILSSGRVGADQDASSSNKANQAAGGGVVDTDQGGLIGIAVPVTIGSGGSNDASSGDASNNAEEGGLLTGALSGLLKRSYAVYDKRQILSSGSLDADQDADSSNRADQIAGGGRTSTNQGGLIGVALPVAVGSGGSNTAESGDATNGAAVGGIGSGLGRDLLGGLLR